MAVQALTYTVETFSGTWTALPPANVVDVRVSQELSGNTGLPVAFGDETTASAEIVCAPATWSIFTDRMPIRVTYTISPTSAQVFQGIIVERTRSLQQVTLKCTSMREQIATTRAYSPAYYRRLVARKTTASSFDDPSNGNYDGGLINWILWQAGGRPYEQAASYPNAMFYYSCDNAILAPDWSWAAGENGWDECLKLARAAGGQLYQGADGVVRYRSPLSYAAGTAGYTFTSSVFGGIEESFPTDQYATKIVATYVPRQAKPLQDVVTDDTPRLVAANASITFNLEPQWPCQSYSLATGAAIPNGGVVATFFDGGNVPWQDAVNGYTTVVTTAAQRLVITFTNNTNKPLVISRIIIKGEPIAAGEPGQVTAGSGTVERTLEDNPYVQSRGHAQRLAELALTFYGTTRAIRTLRDCPLDLARTVGETVNITSADLGLSSVPHLITGMDIDDTGGRVTYKTVSVNALPKAGDYYILGATNYSGQTLKVGF